MININKLGFELLCAGFHTPKAVTYHEPTVMWLFMIGHSLGRMETFFAPGPNDLGAKHPSRRVSWRNIRIRDVFHAIAKHKNTSRIRMLRQFDA